jgi:rod shape-determining protein MreD
MNGETGLVVRWSLIVITAVILQVGVVPQFLVFGVVCDLLLLIAMCAGVVGGPERGAIVGFWCGLLFDLMRGTGALGLSALAYTLAAAAVGALMIQVLQMRRLLAMAVVATGSAAGTLLFAVEGQLFGEHTLTTPRIWTIIAVIAFVNGALATPALRACRWAERRDESAPVLGSIDV